MKILRYFLFGIAVIAPNQSYAYDLKICKDLAESGLVDTRDIEIVEQQALDDYDYVCSKKENRLQRAKSRSGGLSASYAGFGGSINAAKTDSENTESINNICENSKTTFISSSINREKVQSGKHVVRLVKDCITTLSAANVETLIGYTDPSIVSNASFSMIFSFRKGIDAPSRLYRLDGVSADEKAELNCSQIKGGEHVGIYEEPVIIQNETEIRCKKNPDLPVNGIIKFVALDDENQNRHVSFKVLESSQEEDLKERLRVEYRNHFDAKIAELTNSYNELINDHVQNSKVINEKIDARMNKIENRKNSHYLGRVSSCQKKTIPVPVSGTVIQDYNIISTNHFITSDVEDLFGDNAIFEMGMWIESGADGKSWIVNFKPKINYATTGQGKKIWDCSNMPNKNKSAVTLIAVRK